MDDKKYYNQLFFFTTGIIIIGLVGYVRGGRKVTNHIKS